MPLPFWLVAGVVALVLVDRLALWAESRGWVYWRRRRPDSGGGSGILGELIEVFQPSRRHVVAERERQHLTADLPESGAPPLGVDLDAGVVRVPRRDTGSGQVGLCQEGWGQGVADELSPGQGAPSKATSLRQDSTG